MQYPFSSWYKCITVNTGSQELPLTNFPFCLRFSLIDISRVAITGNNLTRAILKSLKLIPLFTLIATFPFMYNMCQALCKHFFFFHIALKRIWQVCYSILLIKIWILQKINNMTKVIHRATKSLPLHLVPKRSLIKAHSIDSYTNYKQNK